MNQFNLLLLVFAVAFLVVGGIYGQYFLYKLVTIDAETREVNRPKLWGWLSLSGENSSGLLLYLIYRRKYPVRNITESQKEEKRVLKSKLLVSIIFIIIGGIGAFAYLWFFV